MIVTDEKNLQLIEYLESLGFPSFPIDGYKVINQYSDLENEINSIYNGSLLINGKPPRYQRIMTILTIGLSCIHLLHLLFFACG